MKQALASLYIAACIICMLGCTEKQEIIPTAHFSDLEIGLRSVDQKASYSIVLDEVKIEDSLKTTDIINKVMVADTVWHRLVLKNNKRNTTIDTVIKLTVPSARYSIVETDTSKNARPLFMKTDGESSDVPKGYTQSYMAWKKSPYYPIPSVKLPDSLQVLLYRVSNTTGAIKKPPAIFNISTNGNAVKVPELLVNDPDKVAYILLFKNSETGKFIPAMGNSAVGSIYDWTAGILLPPFAEKTSRYAYLDVYYGNLGGGMYSIELASVLEY